MSRRVTLTFDNGPDPEVTPRVLDILAERGIRSCFFVVGDKLRDPGRRALAARAHDEGHWIGNHSFNHLSPLGRTLDPDAPSLEIGRTQDLIGPLAHPDLPFRPFGSGGILDDALLSRGAVDFLTRGGFTCVLWNVVPRDWEDPLGWVATALELCATEPWPLVVLHDLPTGAMNRLETFLDGLEAAGFAPVQEFPSACTPIVRGEVVSDISPFLAS